MFPEELVSRIAESRIIAVLVIDDAADAAPLASALLDGGINAMELTLRTPAAIDALREIRRRVPEMTAGIGTILTTRQVGEAKDAGAAFGVAPGFNPVVVEEARKLSLPFAPGIYTPSDIEGAVEMGCRVLKYFPAEPGGGLKYLRAIAAPYAHLGLRYIPLGGIDQENLREYLADPLVLAVGGSWIARREEIRARDWSAIKRKAARAIGGAGLHS